MAKIFIPISEHDTEGLRRILDLPITKGLRYMRKEGGIWKENKVIDYEIVEEYSPSKTASLLITIEDNTQIRILGPYFAHMQKSSFVEDMEAQSESI